MIDITPNKSIFGKRVTEFPWKAEFNGYPLAVGSTKTECQENAVAKLVACHKASQEPMVMVQAKDQTIYVARWIDETQAEYWIYRNGERGGGSIFTCKSSLQRYMAELVADYDRVTEVA